MAHMMVHHRVEHYETWKQVFDEHATARGEAGCTGGRLYRNADDPNDLVIRLSWNTLENARAFTASEDAREKMARAGVIGQPTVVFLDDPVQVER